jgi:hypothetical protein
MKTARVSLICTLLVVNAPGVAACGDSLGRGHKSRANIALSFDRTRPFYYLRADKFVMTFRPEDLLEKLDKYAKRRPSMNAVLTRMRGDLPLAAETDLFKYAFVFPHEMEFIDFAVDQLLEEGRAGVFYSWDLDKDLRGAESILRVAVLSREGETEERVFCTQTQRVLHQVRFVYE